MGASQNRGVQGDIYIYIYTYVMRRLRVPL